MALQVDRFADEAEIIRGGRRFSSLQKQGAISVNFNVLVPPSPNRKADHCSKAEANCLGWGTLKRSFLYLRLPLNPMSVLFGQRDREGCST